MGQEYVEKEISFECLRTAVDNAIKTKNMCIIESIKKENQLRYMQKYAELLISKNDSKISFRSYFIGVYSVILGSAAIGISYILVGNSKNPMLETMYYYLGIGIVIMTAFLWFWLKPHEEKEFNNKNKDAEFMHSIILKIEERLPNSQQQCRILNHCLYPSTDF